ncbi:hypothetical protein C8E17_3448 [Serratia plymuthica]|uniref:Secreted protein n=1 Tax=Serratia plymuthica TaxID=82996 RepID=A0A2X4UFM8_SERPL|nr:hypothetical protein C8E17_3448 [Serratia plymuthica]CAI2439136.1 Uncharacterised protein [Serratia plymuthica]SQI34348.1 Uncharacterised protein [Serratia plymuthica]
MLILRTCVLVLPLSAFANVTVSVTEAPTVPGGMFWAGIVGASESDPTPNPCYERPLCNLSFFTIDESWLPDGWWSGYYTGDAERWIHDDNGSDSDYRTIGSWWASVRNKGRLGHDHLPVAWEKMGPCVVLAASDGKQGGAGPWVHSVELRPGPRTGDVVQNQSKSNRRASRRGPGLGSYPGRDTRHCCNV